MARIRVEEDEFSLEQIAKKARGEQEQHTTSPSSSSHIQGFIQRLHRARMIKIAVGIVALGLLTLAFLAYGLYLERNELRQEITKLKTDPAIAARQESKALLQKVSQLVELPSDEAPTIADVTDANQARSQDNFYKDAQNGDKVLFYTRAGRAILYRPSTNRVINTAPISNTQP